MQRSPNLMITLFAILKAGGAYVPLDASFPEERLLFTLKDCDAPVLIIQSEEKEKFVNYQGVLIVLDEKVDAIKQQSTQNLEPVATRNDLAYIIYTSGSTGKPKGVLIEHGSVIHYAQWFLDYSLCQFQQRIDFSSNYIFDMSVTTTIIPLMNGLTVVICDEEEKINSRRYFNYLKDNKINLIKITPSYFKVLLHEIKTNRMTLPSLQKIILGGENLPAIDCVSWLAMYPTHTIYNEYGPTETTVAISHHEVNAANCKTLALNVPIGKPSSNTDCYILNPDTSLVADGEIGELHIGGICLARGYLNQSELTLARFIKNPFSNDTSTRLYKTGDLCRWQQDGTLEYLGRMDEQIKLRGFRIEPGEIERNLISLPPIDEVAVLIREDKHNEKRLIAYYTQKEASTPLTDNDMRIHLGAHVPEYMIPAAFMKIDVFPLTPNGKLDKTALPLPNFTNNSQKYKKPRSALEKTLAAIWSQEMGIDRVGLNDDFYELGGHSLTAARIVSKINSQLNKDVTLNDLYKAKTIKQLIPVVKASNVGKSVSNQLINDNSHLLPLGNFQFLIWISNRFEPRVKKLNVFTRMRLHGLLNMQALHVAFEAVLKKHECLSYRILKSRPAQEVQTNLPFKIIEKHMESLPLDESELALNASLNELIYYHPWNSNAPLVLARLFHLKDETTELQLCMPHIISDEVSLEILLADLNWFYQRYTPQFSMDTVPVDKHYKDYIFDEEHYSQVHLDRDINFWKTYLSDTHLYTFPTEHIVEDMDAKGFSYSTYSEIPELALQNLKQFCATNHVTMNDGLCAVLALALFNCCGNPKDDGNPIFFNRVKSSRDKVSYDNAIGCFLRLEPVKVITNVQSTLTTLSKQIHQSTMDTSLYQRCSSLTKLACLNEFQQETTLIKKGLIKLFVSIYTTLIRTPKLNPKLLNLYGNLSALDKHKFLININVQNSFITGNKAKEQVLFGVEIKDVELVAYDLVKINSFFDVCFIRSDSQNIPYIVISANLKPAFRELIAQEMMQILLGSGSHRQDLSNSLELQNN